jgi:hypothetical protein
VRANDVHAGKPPLDRVGDTPLVRRIGITVKKRDGDDLRLERRHAVRDATRSAT